MNKTLWAVFLSLVFYASSSRAQLPYLDEVRALGAVAGQGLACGASKYDTFELLARAILISKAPTDEVQAQGMYAYNEEKANAYVSKQYDGFFECPQINRRFDAQPIFQATLYADGTIKMPDGQIITPRRPYDATKIYEKKAGVRDDMQAIYDKAGNKKLKELKIQAAGDEGGVQIVHAPRENEKASAALPAVRDVVPSPGVRETGEDLGGIRHISRKK